MKNDNTLRVAVPSEWSNETAAVALNELAEHLINGENISDVLSKAIKNPAPSTDRARARKTFLRMQGRFTEKISLVFETMDDIVTLVKHEQAPADAVTRAHRRCIAQLNAEFAQSYEEAFRCGLKGAGATRELSDSELAIVRRLRLNENSYAANFLTDIAHGEGKMPYPQRAKLYGNALEEVYWLGYLYADQSSTRFVQWVMPYNKGFEEVEHCPDCAVMSGNSDALEKSKIDAAEARRIGAGGRWGNGIYQAVELAKLGVAPQSGKLACTTNCHCFLKPAKKPTGKAVNKPMKRFRSQEPKDFTGTVRNAKGKIEVTRDGSVARRKRYAVRAEKTDHLHIPRKIRKAILRLFNIGG